MKRNVTALEPIVHLILECREEKWNLLKSKFGIDSAHVGNFRFRTKFSFIQRQPPTNGSAHQLQIVVSENKCSSAVFEPQQTRVVLMILHR